LITVDTTSRDQRKLYYCTISRTRSHCEISDDFICHIAKVKAATPAHSMADVIPFFFAYLLFAFESNASIKPKENVFYPQQRKQYL